MKVSQVIILLLGLTPLFLYAQPTDNPLKTHYGNGGYPNWINQIKWDRVIDMGAYTNGNNDFERFENARDELYNTGGGVLYYPGKAEPYDFSDMPASGEDGRGLMLKSGIVIRGDKPNDSTALDGDLSLTTRFKFPTKLKEGEFPVPEDWAFIGILPDATTGNLRDVQNVGIVWVEIEFGTIYFGYDGAWGETYATAGAWKSSNVLPDWQSRVPDGTFPYDPFCGSPMDTPGYLGAGSGRLVFGCKLMNSTVTNDVFFQGYPGNTGYFNYKFGARIGIYASNIFVANNTMPKPTACFQYRQVTKSGLEKILQFDYGLTHGIDINKNFLNIYGNKITAYTEDNVIIKDNYVWNHGRNGYALSGEYMIVRDNHNERIRLVENNNIYGLGSTWELTMDGWVESQAGSGGSVSDNLSRAFDMAGKNAWVDSNTFNNVGSNPGNDGEGILWQEHGGMGYIPSFAFTRNAFLGGVEKGYIHGYDVHSDGVLWGWNRTGATGNAEKSDRTYNYCDVSGVENYKLDGTTPSGIADVFIVPCVTAPNAPVNVTAELVDSAYVEISWEDNSSDESGFRIDRSIGDNSSWEILVVRPRKESPASCAHNQTMWRDYCFPLGVDTYYRVVPLSCDFNGGNTTAEVGPIQIITSADCCRSNIEAAAACHVYPNPAKQFINVQIPGNLQAAELSIRSISGQIVYSRQLDEVVTTISTEGINPGLYLLSIQNETIRVNKKVIIAK